MQEEIGNALRIGFTTVMIASLLAVVLNFMVRGTQMLDGFIVQYEASVDAANSSTILDLNGVDSVGAPVAYKLIDENIDAIKTISITYLDGTVTSDYKSLLKNANKTVEVKVESSGRGEYLFTVNEVRR